MPIPPSGAWRIATRRSALAQAQARQVGRSLEVETGRPYELVPLATTADEHPDRAIESFDVKGLFVDRTRQAVRDGDCDLVVHSHKDLPTEPADGLVVAAVPPRVDPRDVLVTRDGWALDELPTDGAVVVGTSSARRRAQIRHRRPGVAVRALRGNITTRLRRVADGELDAVVIAHAGLLRLAPGLDGLVARPLTHEEMVHAPAQGALAIECRVDDPATIAALERIDDAVTRAEVAAERALLVALQGGCTAPIGAHAELRDRAGDESSLVLLGALGDTDATRVVRAEVRGAAGDARELGAELAVMLRGRLADGDVADGDADGA